jgi:putative ABC transport system substrate-binding protein
MKKLNRLAALATAAALLAGCSSSASTDSSETAATQNYTVGLAQLVDHTSLNTIRDAIYDEFEELGYVDGENITIDYQNAAGATNTLDTIMASYASEDVDAIIAIATPTAQAAQNYSDEIPVIFSAVSDPVGAGLVESTDAPGTNITGTSDEVQVDQIIDLILEILPDTKTVGVLYNASEANSVTNIANFKEYAETKGLEVVEKTGTDLTTMQQAASSLVKDVDVLFSPNDNTVASGMNALADIAAQAGVPYFVGADSMVQDGGFATVGIDYEELGRETARMTVDILNGADPATTAVKIFKTDLNVYVNQSILDQLGIELPDSVANNEKLIIVE